MRRSLCLVLIAFALANARPLTAAEAPPTVVAATLDNGLRVLLLEDRRSPIVTVQTWYRVGSRNEARGATGIAHFLEHLMFRGTAKHGPGVFARLVERNGGQDNAFTSQDVTSYFVNIAADRLDLVLELEADRMHNLVLDPKIIDAERQVVIEERRTRTEDDPGGVLGEEVSALAFRAHPYGPPMSWPRSRRPSAPPRAGRPRRPSPRSSPCRMASAGCSSTSRRSCRSCTSATRCPTSNRPTPRRWRCCRWCWLPDARRACTAISSTSGSWRSRPAA